MELVYLWVEDYKNIKNQGFNFSPRFRCEYDSENNELTIKENENYIENFFGENINVTAIVGKNGSGKSSINEVMQSISVYDPVSMKTNIYYKYLAIFKIKNIHKDFIVNTKKEIYLVTNIKKIIYPNDILYIYKDNITFLYDTIF